MMPPTRTLLIALALQTLALGAAAQSGGATEPGAIEFGRASSGTIHAIAKDSGALSGSLSMTHSTGRGQGYDGTLGGELLDERLWFFGAAAIVPAMRLSSPAIAALDATATATPVDWTTATASLHRLQPGLAGSDPAPATFLSLRSDSLLSDRTMLSFSYSRSSAPRTAFPLDAVSTGR